MSTTQYEYDSAFDFTVEEGPSTQRLKIMENVIEEAKTAGRVALSTAVRCRFRMRTLSGVRVYPILITDIRWSGDPWDPTTRVMIQGIMYRGRRIAGWYNPASRQGELLGEAL